MRKDIEQIRQHVGNNKLDLAFDTFLQLIKEDDDMNSQILLLLAKYKDVRRKENLGLINFGEASIIRAQVNYALLNLISEYEKKLNENSVFISYNHSDSQVANRLKEMLRDRDISVIIDSEQMSAGEDIKSFIENSISKTKVTISIISKRSLMSAWVAMESIKTYYLESSNPLKKFIGCYIEDDFFDRNFTDEALNLIDKQLKEIEALRIGRSKKGRNTRDLDNEFTRLKELSNGIDEIIRRLRESLCIDIRNGNLEKNFGKILASIQP